MARIPLLQPLCSFGGCELLCSLIFQLFLLYLAVDLLSSSGASDFSFPLPLDITYLFSAPGCSVSYVPGPIKTPPWLQCNHPVLCPPQSTPPLLSPPPSDPCYKPGVYVDLFFPSSMSNNFILTPEDCLQWERRAPHASYWLVSGRCDLLPY